MKQMKIIGPFSSTGDPFFTMLEEGINKLYRDGKVYDVDYKVNIADHNDELIITAFITYEHTDPIKRCKFDGCECGIGDGLYEMTGGYCTRHAEEKQNV